MSTSTSKKMKLAKLAVEEWQLPLQTEVEKGGYPATCKEFKLHIQKAGGTASGYRPLATRVADTAKPFYKFSWQYQSLMKELVAVGTATARMIVCCPCTMADRSFRCRARVELWRGGSP